MSLSPSRILSKLRLAGLASLTAAAFTMTTVDAGLLRFDPADAGRLITSADGLQRYLGSVGVRITPTGNSGPDLATLYDSSVTGGEDADLEKPYHTGNAGVNGGFDLTDEVGALLILQEHVTAAELAAGQLSLPRGRSMPENGGSADGILNAPDDGGTGGFLLLQFEEPLATFQTLIPDIEIAGSDNHTPHDFSDDFGARIAFRDLDANGNLLAEAVVYITESLSATFDVPGHGVVHLGNLELGNNSLNLTPLFKAGKGDLSSLGNIDEIDVRFGSNSGGIAFINASFADKEANHSLGSTVFCDLNGNGIYDAGDTPVPHVEVRLVDPSPQGNIIRRATTDSAGNYLFTELRAGDYRVEIAADQFKTHGPLAGKVSIPGTIAADNNIDNDDDGVPFNGGVRSAIINLSAGDELTDGNGEVAGFGGDLDNSAPGGDDNGNTTVDFGFTSGLAAVGDLAFLDADGDGIQDTGEDGVSGVLFQLVDAAGNVVTDGNGQPFEAISGPDGSWAIDGIPPGHYRIKVTVPADSLLELTIKGAGGDPSLDSSYVGAGTKMGLSHPFGLVANENNPTFDAGFVSVPPAVTTFDFGDAPNTYDTSGGTAAKHGIINQLALGSSVDAESDGAPGALADGDDASGVDDEDGVTFPDGPVISAGNDSFVAKVVVRDVGGDTFLNASDDFGPDDDVTPKSYTTGSGWAGPWLETNDTAEFTFSGHITVADDMPDAGNVQIILPSDATDHFDSDTDDGNAVLIKGTNFANFPLGVRSVCLRSNGILYRSFDFSGATEDAILSFDYHRVDLEGGENDRMEVYVRPSDSSGQATLIHTIGGGDENGTGFLSSGNIVIPQATLAAGQLDVLFWLRGDNFHPGEDLICLDNVSIAASGGSPRLVGWIDFDGNGSFDADEASVIDPADLVADGVSKNMVMWNGVPALIDGFSGVTYARFRVSSSGNLAANTPGGTMGDGEVEDYQIFVGASASLGNRVFRDANDDGKQNSGEPGIAGVLVELFDATDTGFTNPLATDITEGADGSLGRYFFEDLDPSIDYVVRVTPPASDPLSSSPDVTDINDNQQNKDDNGIQDFPGGPIVSPVIALDPGESDTTVDFGLLAPASVGDFVFLDGNNNGKLDGGEGGLADVIVEIFAADDTDFSDPLDDTLTDENGAYLFENVAPGSYVVKFTRPAGSTLVAAVSGPDNPAMGLGGAMAGMSVNGAITVASGDAITDQDGAFTGGVALGNRVFFDENGDGVLNGSDTGINGLLVELLDATGTTVLATDTTSTREGEAGRYLFDNLQPDTKYVVRVTPNSAAPIASAPKTGADNENSGSQSAPGQPSVSDPIKLGQVDDLTVDFGFTQEGSAAIGDFAFFDANGNGIQDPNEPGVEGAVFKVFDANGGLVGKSISDEDGRWFVGGLAPGTYTVKASVPAGSGYIFTFKEAGSDRGRDSNFPVGGSTGVTEPITLLNGETNPTIDAGFYPGFPKGDFSDAPSSYSEGVAPVHLLSNGTKLGAAVDAENGPVPAAVGADAIGDDAVGSEDDEDGITFPNGNDIFLSAPTPQDFVLKAVVMGDDFTGTLTANDIFDVPTESSVSYALGFGWTGTWDESEGGGNPATGNVRVATPGTDISGDPGALGLEQGYALCLKGNTTVARTFDFSEAVGDGTATLAFRREGLEGNNSFEIRIEEVNDTGVAPATLTITGGIDGDGDLENNENDPLDYSSVATISIPQALLNAGELRIIIDGASSNAATDAICFDEINIDAPAATSRPDLVVWVDFDRNGTFEPDEAKAVASDVLIADGVTENMIMWTGAEIAALLGGSTAPVTYARARVSNDPSLSPSTPFGGLADGEVEDYLINIVSSSSLGDLVFFDVDGDGEYEPGEGDAPIGGITVELLDENGAVIAVTTTDATTGEYLFPNLSGGETYQVRVTPPASAPTASGNAPGGDNQNSGVQSASGEPSISAPVFLPGGTNDLTVDFGFQPRFALGNLVFIDNNDNSVFDTGDTPVNGVTLTLFAADDPATPLNTTVTDTVESQDGRYLFSGLAAGCYIVQVDPANFLPTSQGGNGILRTVLGPLNASALNDGDAGIDDDLGQNGKLSPSPETIGVFSDQICLGPDLNEPSASETGVAGDSDDGAGDLATDLTIDFGFRDFEVDSQGCFYISGTGEIVPGGGISVQRTADLAGNAIVDGPVSDGPGGVNDSPNIEVSEDGSSGCFAWIVKGIDGTFCVTYQIPAGYQIDPDFSFEDANGGTPYDPGTSGIPAQLGEQIVGQIDIDNDGFLDAGTGFVSGSAGSLSANPSYRKFVFEGGDPLVVGINVPLVKTENFVSWVASQAAFPELTSPEASPTGNPDRDAYSNAIEYAFCLNGASGVKTFPNGSGFNPGFRIEEEKQGGSSADDDVVLNACFNRPPAVSDTIYVLEVYDPAPADGSDPGWIGFDLVEAPTLPAQGEVQFSTLAGEAGSEKVTIANLETQLGLGGENTIGIVRMVATVTTLDETTTGDLTDTVTVTDVTTPQGWSRRPIDPICETIGDPFNQPCLFTGTIAFPTTGNDGFTIDFSDSVRGADLTSVLDFDNPPTAANPFNPLNSLGNPRFYLEIVSGAREGEILDVVAFTGDTVTIANDTDLYAGPINSTHLGGLDASFEGGLAVLREHKVVTDIYPVEAFNAGGTDLNGSQILRLDRTSGNLESINLRSNPFGGAQWRRAGSTVSLNDLVIPPAEGGFSHNRGVTGLTPFSRVTSGEVRTNALNVPLQEGDNFVAAIYPVPQSPFSRDLLLNGGVGSNAFTGGNSAQRADRILVWKADLLTEADANAQGEFPEVFGYDDYFLLNASPTLQFWLLRTGGASSSDDEALFMPTRSALISINDESSAASNDDDMPDYLMPAQISNAIQ